MPKTTNLRPHPAFDYSLLSQFRHSKPSTLVSATQDVTKYGPPVRHYPRYYLSYMQPIKMTIDHLYDLIGSGLMQVVSVATWLVALFNPMWLVDSEMLNMGSFFSNYDETIFFRRGLLLTGVAWCSPLAMAFAYHLRGIFTNTDNVEMVQSLLGEYQSHRTHYFSFVQVLKPSIFTRLLLLIAQAVIVPFVFFTCLIYPPVAHSTAAFAASYGMELYTNAIKEMEKGQMPEVAKLHAPPISQWMYGLPPNTSFYDALTNFRADDAWHTFFNEACCESNYPVRTIEKFIDTGNVETKSVQ